MTKKIKILILSHISDLAGGAEMSMLDTMDYWAKNYNIEPEFILRSPLKRLAGALSERRWKYHELPYTFWSDAIPPVKSEDIFKSALVNSRAVRLVEDIIATSKPDIVVTNSVVSPWAALAAYFSKVPHVWFVREYGDLDHGRVYEIGREATLSDVGSLSDLVVANSKTLANHIGQYVNADKLTTMYTPFKLNEIGERAKETVDNPFKANNSLKLVITGSLAVSKGQKEAIEAIGKVNKLGFTTELCIIGGNGSKEYTNQLNSLIEEYSIQDKIHFVGFQSNPLAYLTIADVGIMASRKEAFGRVTFEYLVAGKAVVGANSGATPEMVSDGHNGYLYEQGNSESLAKVIMHYAKDRSLVNKHGKNSLLIAQNMMSGEYNADALYDRIVDVIKSAPAVSRHPINFLHRWMEYMDVAEQCIDNSGTLSIKRLVRLKVRQKVKAVYYRIRSFKAKVTGR